MYKKVFLCIIVGLSISLQSVFGAEIIRLTKSNLNLLPKGKEVDGMIGDWIIKNNKVIAIIGNALPDREANQMVSSVQGAVLDFTKLSHNNDQLTVYYPQGARIDIPSADTIIVMQSDGKIVQLKAVKFATAKEPFVAETIYSLNDGEEYLRVQTTFRNSTKNAVKVLIYDVIRCDNGIADITPAGINNMAFVYNKWYAAAYGVFSKQRKLFTPSTLMKKNLAAQGHKIFFSALAGNTQDSTVLEAGKEISISRFLLTGTNVSDMKSQTVVQDVYKDLKLNIKVNDKKGNFLGDVFIDARNKNNALISSAKTKSDGTAIMYVPKGDFSIIVSKIGHDTLSKSINISSGNQDLNFSLKPQSQIAFNISDSINEFLPVKIEFRGIRGTKDPFLGPVTRSNGIQNLYYANSRNFSVPLPEGNYQVIISHGPEYHAEVIATKVSPGEEAAHRVKLKRAFSSPDYIIGDLHNHTTGSGDSNAGIADRVINMAASGIEFAPATEHNRISSYSDVIKQLGLQKFIASAAGMELSGRPGPGETNHQIGFPLKIQPEKRGYGAPKTDKDPYVQMKRLYDYDNGKFKLMQQNHPEISTLYFDKNKDGIADKGYGTEEFTDVMEIRESMLGIPEAVNGGDADTRSFQWLQMLNLGYRIFGVANTDGHAVGHASGSMFNYIYTDLDEPEKIDAIDIAQQVKKGRVIISNGPFMTVKVNDALPGSEIKADKGKIGIDIKILTANWCKINRVQILVNGKADTSLTFKAKKHTSLFSGAAYAFTNQVFLSLKEDSHIIVLAYGEGESIGLVNGDKQIMPLALSNPVFVDTDGNGFIPNKDLMGHILPVKKVAKPAMD